MKIHSEPRVCVHNVYIHWLRNVSFSILVYISNSIQIQRLNSCVYRSILCVYDFYLSLTDSISVLHSKFFIILKLIYLKLYFLQLIASKAQYKIYNANGCCHNTKWQNKISLNFNYRWQKKVHGKWNHTKPSIL